MLPTLTKYVYLHWASHVYAMKCVWPVYITGKSATIFIEIGWFENQILTFHCFTNRNFINRSIQMGMDHCATWACYSNWSDHMYLICIYTPFARLCFTSVDCHTKIPNSLLNSVLCTCYISNSSSELIIYDVTASSFQGSSSGFPS